MTLEPTTQFWEKFGTWAAVALLALSIYHVKNLETRLGNAEQTIVALSVDKVSRPELKELEYRLRSDMASVKSEIIERMDWHFRNSKNDKK